MAKILVVEDDPVTRTEYRMVLEPCGENILFPAEDSVRAINALKENPDIDIVFLDRMLARKTCGDEVADYLKNLWRTQSRDGAIKRPLLVTAASELFEVDGAAGVYKKHYLLEILWDAQNDNSFINQLMQKNGLSPKEPVKTVQIQQVHLNK